MSFFDTLKNLGLFQPQQGQQPQQNPYGLDPAVYKQAQMSALGNIGGQIMALSQQMTPDQRARMMANADWSGGLQKNLYNAAQMKLMGDAGRQKQEESERDRAAKEFIMQRLDAMPDGPQKKKGMIYAQLGDFGKAAEAITAEPAAPEYQLIDGYYVHKTDPSVPAIPIQGMAPQVAEIDPKDRLPFIDRYEKDPQVQAYNVLASTIGSLAGAVYDDSKVSDLDFVYGVAKALDPTSVVRESEGQMVIDAQGLDAATLGRINSLWGGGALLPQQRLELLALVKRRAENLRPFVETQRENILGLGAGLIDERHIRPIAPLADIPLQPPQIINRSGRSDLLMPFPEPELLRVE